MAAAFRKLFRTLDKINNSNGNGRNKKNNQEKGSPIKKLFGRYGYHGDVVTPTSSSENVDALNNEDVFKKNNCSLTVDSSSQKTVRVKRLMKELKDIQKNQTSDPIFTVELINDNLYEWNVRLHRIDYESDLAADMRDLGIGFISLQITFPDNFPFAPPFMRVISPRIEKGFVMDGGAICMELLTPRGWASAYTVEAVIMQFAASIVKGKGRIARKSASKDFSKRSAEEAFRRVIKTHDKYGWVTPPLADG